MKLHGFYAVLDRDDEQLARTLAGVACVLQVRLKPRSGPTDTSTIVRVARMARRICDEARIPLVVNDRIDIALVVGADAVHLGQTDLSIADARRIAGSLVIGVSTHDVAQARAACEAGADYIGFGPIFATTTKLNPDPVQGLDGLRAAVVVARRSGVPIVAIGGIAPANAGEVFAAGASAICAIGAVNDAGDVATAARAFRSVTDPIVNDSMV